MGRRAHCPKKSNRYWGGGLEEGAEGSLSQYVMLLLGWKAAKKGRRAHCPKKSFKCLGGGLELGAEGSLSKKVIQILGWRARNRGGGLIVPKSYSNFRVEG